jgi:ADP-ribose pyrophosphatase YjhB (NUDIX family)
MPMAISALPENPAPGSRRTARFCLDCGGALAVATVPNETRSRLKCQACGRVHYEAPSVAVLTLLFAEHHLLLVKRGVPPYAGKWAPPGGFVEQDESLEAAAAREVNEEVGIHLTCESLIPNAMASLPHIQQVCVVFLAQLDRRVPPRTTTPEVLEAAWFKEEDYPSDCIWDPGTHLDARHIYEQVRVGRFDFYQQTEDFFRVISNGLSIRYLPHKKP